MSSSNDIAIIGMALRVPGAATPEEFWHNLKTGHESLQSYSVEALRNLGVPPSQLADPDYVRAGMPLEGFDEFDPEFFGFSPKDAAILDPQHRLFYEVSWEALERAGCVPRRFKGAIGVFAGSGMAAYLAQNVMRNSELMHSVGLFLLRHTGNDKDFLTTRVSYAFDLKGPSINVQTACSTSLVAVHMGVQGLLSREVDLVLAGGVTIELPHGVGYTYKEGEILSPDGHCRAFDHRAQGTVFGSGVGVVALRRLEDALRDGDHIHAIIKASAINNDGASKVGYLAPSVEGQAAAVSEAIALAGIDSSSIRFVECHGTGTPMGDPIEVAALTQAFRESSSAVGHCLLGSVKSNIGHLDTAAGVVGLIKAVQALEYEAVPPTPHFERNNPAIDFEGGPFTVAKALIPWPRGAVPRRAGVNSLGVGGTNAFVILEEAPRQQLRADRPEELIAFSARSRKALDDYGLKLREWIGANPQASMRSFAATLGRARQAFEHRRVFSASSLQEAAALIEKPDAREVFTHVAELDRPAIVFMFPGGGAQYPGMARGLYATEPVFRDSMDRSLDLLKHKHGLDLKELFLGEGGDAAAAQMHRPSLQLPLVFLLELALVDLWRSRGIEPDALIGHSMGENAAACVAGVFSREEGLALVVLRGQLMDEVPEGGMLSVAMGADDLREVIGSDLDLAASNSPQLSIASGPRPALDALSRKLSAQGIESRRVRIDIAAHSRMLDGILGRFRGFLRSMTLKPPSVRIVSNLTGNWLSDAEATDPEYWVRHVRNTVRYAEGIRKLLETPQRVFIEVGPGTILGSFVRQTHGAPAQRVVGSLRHPEDPVADGRYFRTVLGRLWAMGVEVPEEHLWCPKAQKIPLPTYPFQHSRYWIEPSEQDAVDAQYDALVPERAPAEDWFWTPRWVQKGLYDSGELAPMVWCVFHDRDPLLVQCIEKLRELGHRVIEVVAGDTYSRESSEQYTVAPEGGGSAYQSLVQSLLKDELLPDRIVHAWLVTRNENYRPGRTFLHRNQESGFYSLFYLARAFAKYADDKPMHWTVVGNEAVSAAGERLRHPDKATALGACAVIPRELPWVTCAYVDVDIQTGAEATTTANWHLMDELRASPANEVVAWRSKVRWQRYLAPMKGKPVAAPVQIRDGGTYLITGGFGGIAGVTADWLARDHRANLVLMARTPLPPRADWIDWLSEHDAADAISRSILRIQELESLGATVLPVAADVAVAEQMEDAFHAIREAFGRIDGVFHAAGVLRDGLLALKSEREIEEVLAPKLYGTRVLDELLQAHPPDFLVLFSSLSSFVAPVGQLDYVAANSFLNAFAESCSERRPYRVAAVNWGIWNGIGMVAPLLGVADAEETWKQQISRSEKRPVRERRFSTHHVGSDGTSALHWIEGRVSVKGDWMISEHRLARGDALLPATGYIEIIRAAMVEVGLETSRHAIHALTLLRPFYVEEHIPATYRLRLLGGPGRWRVEVFLVGGRAANRFELLATARLAPVVPATEDVPGINVLRDRCTAHLETAGSGGLRTRQESHIRFGPRWGVLRRIGFGEGEAFAHIELEPSLRGDLLDHPSHPGMLDVATGCAMDLIPGYREQETPLNLWVPQGYGRYAQYRPLPAVLRSWIRLRSGGSVEAGKAQFDVMLLDEEGDVVAELEDLQLHKLQGVLPPPATASGADARPQSPAEKALTHNLRSGFSSMDGELAIRRLLASMGTPVQIASTIRPADLLRQGDAVAHLYRKSENVRFARPELDSSYEAPRDELEKSLAEVWGRLLGVEGVGIRDSFFDLGGHSLVAVRLFNEIADKHGMDLPLSALMQHPDIASLAERIRGGAPGPRVVEDASSPSVSAGPEPEFNYIVPMHATTVGAGVPFFMVAGMFGNVLNLSHMAHLLGEDRPFYALQARGLFAGQEPFETFEEMATAYLVEVRRLQPRGPYLLGGFSGGGLVAFEMARQLLAAGDTVASIVMLDTPIRENDKLSRFNKMELIWNGLKEEGLRHIGRKLHERKTWKQAMQQRERERDLEHVAGSVDQHRFRSQRVGDAFVRALHSYVIKPAPVQVALFRPRLRIKYTLRDGRTFAADRTILLPDNGWTPYVAKLSVAEVPGNHDSMVLEPNVRVLVQSMRRSLQIALSATAGAQ